MLKNSQLFKEVPKKTDEDEHSLELQYPFLKLCLQDNAKVVPIMIRKLHNLDKICDLLLPFFLDNESLFVFSSDFCHWGKRFDFTPNDIKNETIYNTIQHLNFEGFKHIKNKKLK